MAEVLGVEFRRLPGHTHRTFFKRFADAAASPVYYRPYSDLRQPASIPIFGGENPHVIYLCHTFSFCAIKTLRDFAGT
jgi:hypothetical protein